VLVTPSLSEEDSEFFSLQRRCLVFELALALLETFEVFLRGVAPFSWTCRHSEKRGLMEYPLAIILEAGNPMACLPPCDGFRFAAIPPQNFPCLAFSALASGGPGFSFE